MQKRIVITGLGAVTAAGEGAPALWDAVLQGHSGVRAVTFGENGTRAALIGADVRDFQPEKYITQRKSLKVMARDIQLAVAASSLALEDSGLKTVPYDHERFGVIVGSGVLNYELDELAYSVKNSVDTDGNLDLKKFGEDGMSALFPLWLLKYLPNMPACHVSILFDLQGPNNTITTGSSAGLQAVEEACRIIDRGGADLMLAGGAESKLNPVGISHGHVLDVLRKGAHADPASAYRVFDGASDGFVLGEGAGFLVLEELSHAEKRGAKIYAEITGIGSSSKTGLEVALGAALDEARISPNEVGCIQVSGVGIKKDDEMEVHALDRVFGAEAANVFLSASKPVTGFTGFASGVLDLIVSALTLYSQVVPPTINVKTPIGKSGFKTVSTASPVKKDIRYTMTNAFGFNGQSVSVVSKKYAKGPS